jgi:hypothetical protein
MCRTRASDPAHISLTPEPASRGTNKIEAHPSRWGAGEGRSRALLNLACRDLTAGKQVLGSPDGAQWLMNQGRVVFSQLISFLSDSYESGWAWQ